MRFSCSCGVFIGFILAMLLSGTAYYYFHLRENPELAAKGVQQVETQWNKAKDTIDDTFEKTKSLTRKMSDD
ncbi:MAG: hypothetical protein E7043_08510 [Lentisphaerae bacterium]|nr:hypothetical protein [Lentisphaerota bacterium]